MSGKSKTSEQAADITALLRARNPLIWIVSREEARVEGYVFEAAAAAGYLVRYWDVAAGVTDAAGKPQTNIGGNDPEGAPGPSGHFPQRPEQEIAA